MPDHHAIDQVLRRDWQHEAASRFTSIRQKLPASSPIRGFTSFQTSGITFFSFGFGRAAVSAAVVALPVPRTGRSGDGNPPPNRDELTLEAILVFS